MLRAMSVTLARSSEAPVDSSPKMIVSAGRPLDRVAERADTARDDRDLVHLVGPGQRQRDERVPHLVMGDHLALMRVQEPVLLFQAGDDALDRRGEIG